MNVQLPPDFAQSAQAAPAAAAEKPKPAYKSYVVWGYAAVAILVLGLGLWAVVAQIRGAVIAPGFVAVDGKPAIIQHLDGGIVGEVLVRDGVQVEAGEALMRLDPTEINANREIVDVQLNETRALVERLKAERDGLSVIAFPDDLIRASVNEPRVARAIEGQRKLFAARQSAMRGQMGQLSQRVFQLEEQISGMRSLIRSNQGQLDKIREEARDKRELVEKGWLAKPAVLALEREQLRLQGDLESRLSEVSRLQAQIVETRAQMAQLQRDQQAEVLSELRQAEVEASGFREQLTAAEAQAGRVDILAPVSGTVHNVSITTTGGVIQPAMELMQIIPSDAQLVLIAQVQPQDIDQVYPGQAATVRFSAFNARTTPELNGFVKRIAPDRLIDEVTGFPYYEVEVDVPQDELDRLPPNLTLLPGMPAEAFMQTESRSVLDYLLKPATDAVRRAGREE